MYVNNKAIIIYETEIKKMRGEKKNIYRLLVFKKYSLINAPMCPNKFS